MRVAAHQPNFAPWRGFFDKLMEADAFVLLDTVPYTRTGYQNRVYLKGTSGARQWLTVPVIRKGRFAQPTCDVEINPTERWRDTHLKTLHTLLGKAPRRDALFECIEPIYAEQNGDRLVDFNIALIREIARRLGISTPILLASDLGCEGRASQLLRDLTKAAGGDVYLSGPTGRDYLEPELFEQEGIALEYHEFDEQPYPQVFGEFLPGLSCFDYIANVGFVPWRDPPRRG